MPTLAFINHELVRWARERRRYSVEESANLLGVAPERWMAWEDGDERPTFRQAQTLARVLSVSFGYLFLPAVPSDHLELPDLRTVSGRPPAAPSPELTDVVNDVLRKQQWYREFLEDEGAAEVPFIGRYSEHDGDWEKIATEIRDTFGINTDLRRLSIGWEDFLRRLVRRIEDSGVLVLRNSVVGNNNHRPLNVEEFRGFAISHSLAPVIFINSKDALSAQIFTLVHELAHLWIGSTGVSNPDYRRSFSEQSNTTENMCNYVAAESLLPARDLQAIWDDQSSITDNLSELSRAYRISSLVVLRRAYDLSKIGPDEYRNTYRSIYGNRSRIKDDTSEGGNFYNNLLSKNSRTFTSSLIRSLEEGKVGYLEAADLLGIHFGTLDGVYENLVQGKIGA
jgi:Zn-dependent peptidase ImmA (M78 family)/DNA-binding XRE family transcriptional regulator